MEFKGGLKGNGRAFKWNSKEVFKEIVEVSGQSLKEVLKAIEGFLNGVQRES